MVRRARRPRTSDQLPLLAMGSEEEEACPCWGHD